MHNAHNGLLRPHCNSLSILYRALDCLVLSGSLQLSLRLCGIEGGYGYGLALAWAMALFLLAAEVGGLYNSWRLDLLRHELRRALWVWLGVACALIVSAFLSDTAAQYSRRALLCWLLLAPMCFTALRIVLRTVLYMLREHGHNTRTVAFAGAGNLAQRIAHMVEAAPWLGLRTVGVYDQQARSCGPLPLCGKLEQLVEDARCGKVDYIYITLPMRDEAAIAELIAELADTPASVYVVPDHFVFDLLHARWLSMNGMPIVGVYESPFFGVNGMLKRAEDLLLGSLILLLIAPLMLLIAVGVKLSSPGPVIFRQRRYGLNGRVIDVWKFRSMSVCEDGEQVPQAQRRDPRVTRFGAFLRRTSLDELPQFINVLQGSMSIVGPRPHAVAHNEHYRRLIHGYMLRHRVKPGITGWAQINGWRGETDTLEKMQRRIDCDMSYVRNWSLWLDLVIVFRTVWQGFVAKEAY